MSELTITAERHGEVVAPNSPGTRTQKQVIDALKSEGLDEKVAYTFSSQTAFTRARAKLSKSRIIKKKSEDRNAGTITYQLNKEVFVANKWEYPEETELTLDTNTGQISCSVPELKKLAQEELVRCMEDRTRGDITRMVKDMFRKHAEIFDIDNNGGSYLVPHIYKGFVDKIHGFIKHLGGQMYRLPIIKGDSEGDQSVADIIRIGMEKVVAEMEEATLRCEEMERTGSIEKCAADVKEARAKVESWAYMFAENKNELLGRLDSNQSKLQERLDKIAGRGQLNKALGIKKKKP